MMQTSDKLRQLAQAVRDAGLLNHNEAKDLLDAVARDLEALAAQFDAIRTCQEVVHDP